MESDLLRVWGVDVSDVFDDDKPLSPARVVRLVSTLGEDSALVSAQRGGSQFYGWNTDRYIQRKLLFVAEQIVYVTAKANGDRKMKPPEPIDTPDAKHQRHYKGQSSFAAMARRALGRGEG